MLSDENKRAQYDRFGHSGPQQGFGGSQGFGGQDFSGFGGFEDIFGSFFGGGVLEEILTLQDKVMIYNIA